MSWVRIEGGDVILGQHSKALSKLMDIFNALIVEHAGESTAEILNRIVDGEGVNLTDEVEDLARKIAKTYLGEKAVANIEMFERLRLSLADVEALPDEKRVFGWPAVKHKATTALDPFVLTLDASGGMDLQVISGDKKDDKAIAAFNLHGKVHPKVGLKGGLPVTANASGYLSRSVSYQMNYDKMVRTGRGFVDVLHRASHRLYEFDDVMSGFNILAPRPTNDLDGIIPNAQQRIEYSGTLGGDIGFSAKVKLPPKPGMSTNFSAAANASFSREFKTIISKKDSKTLRLETDFKAQESTALSMGVGASVGLSAIDPELANRLLEFSGGAEKVLNKINEVWGDSTGKLKTWLKPGAALHSKINTVLGNQLTSSDGGKALTQFLAFLTGVDDGAVAENVDRIQAAGARFIADMIDDAKNIFDIDEDHDEVFQDIAERIIAEAGGQFGIVEELDEIKKRINKVLSEAGSLFQDKLKEAADHLDNATEENFDKILKRLVGASSSTIINRVNEFLNDSRSILGDIVNRIGTISTEAVAVELAWRRNMTNRRVAHYACDISADGQAFYRQAILHPEKAARSIFEADANIEGADFDPTTSILETYRRGEAFDWNIAVLSFASIGSKKKLSAAHVQSGVGGKIIGVGAKGSLYKHTSNWAEGRAISFNDVLIVGDIQQEDGEQIVPSFSINVLQAEKNVSLKDDEIKKFVGDFVAAGVIAASDGLSLGQDMTAVRRAMGKKKVGGSYSLSLSVPPASVEGMLTQMSRITPKNAHNIAVEALVSNQRFRKILKKKIKLTAREYGRGFPHGETDFREALNNSAWIFEAMKKNHDRSSAQSDRRVREAKNFWRSMRDLHIGVVSIVSELIGIREDLLAYKALDSTFRDERKRIQRHLVGRQDSIIDAIDPWMKTGMPGLSDHIPEITASFFKVILDLITQTTGVRPAPVLRLELDGGEKKIFVSS